MADVFISYRNTQDRRIIVRRLATILRAHEISVWWDCGLEAGESYRAQITAELASARIVSPLWCAESIQSPWVKMEAELGKDKLVPARLRPEDNVTRFRNRLRGLRDRWRAGTVSRADVDARIRAWIAHADHADTFWLRQAMFEDGWFEPVPGMP